MINKIVHCGDIHIRKSLDRHEEYREVFNKFYKQLEIINPDRIVITGDLYDNFIDIEGEALLLVGEFLNKLSSFSKVIIIKGNHDYRKKHITRIDTIETVTTLLENSGVTYYSKSGFYEDDNVVWCVWDHSDGLSPWKDIKTKRDKSKIYIDLFHDPIFGCYLPNGIIMKGKYRDISEFKGDYSLFSDIHIRQYYKNKTKGFSSSLIQQSFGEKVNGHGFNILDFNKGFLEPIDIDNDYKFINIPINQNVDYDNIKLNFNFEKSDKIKVKIKWEDFSVNMNTENEKKIRFLIKENLGSELIQIESRPLYTDVSDTKLISETIDINDPIVQQNILREFLLRNEITDETINEIISIDNIINNRLEIKKSNNTKWSIEKIWFNNFKSYDNNIVIDFTDIHGIIQIHGINQQGKTTILDVITYILYGTTMTTEKREKFGDNRYINNKRKLNHCDGGITINIDGEKYLIYRKTERKLNKQGEITSCSTKLDYYKGTEMIEKNKLVGETNIKTQQELDSIIGNFQDFIRLTLTNADNINELLSIDRSVFIDNIIRDAGYDVFDKKLNEFKEYKKSLNLEKININVDKVSKEIDELLDKIKIDKEKIKEISKNVDDKEKESDSLQKEKEIFISKLNKIDDEIIRLDYDDLKTDIELCDNNIQYDYQSIKDLENKVDQLPKDFDNTELQKQRELYEKYKDGLSNADLELSRLDRGKSDLEYDIKDIDNKVKYKRTDFEKNILDKIKSYETDIRFLENDITNLKKDGTKIKDNIDKLKNSNTETKICPTCLRQLDDHSSEHFEKEILKNKEELEKISSIGKDKINKIKGIREKIDILNVENIDENEEFISFINNIEKEKNLIELKIKEKDDKITSIKNKISEVKPKIDSIKDTVNKLESDKNNYDKKLSIESRIKDIRIKIKENKTENDKKKEKLNKYLENKQFIDDNKKINEEINNLNKNILNISNNIKEFNNLKIELNNNIVLRKKVIDDYEEKIEKFKNQEKSEFINNTYMKSMHRDGLPTYLLKKSIHIINNELNNLLSNVDFNLLFDNELNLKMKSKNDEQEYNAVEGSGKERTFNSCALKIALRKINNTSKPNFILFDEIMTKLVDNSVEEFTEFLYELKNHIDKILLIEHIHQIKYDYLINVSKDKNGISTLNIY